MKTIKTFVTAIVSAMLILSPVAYADKRGSCGFSSIITKGERKNENNKNVRNSDCICDADIKSCCVC